MIFTVTPWWWFSGRALLDLRAFQQEIGSSPSPAFFLPVAAVLPSPWQITAGSWQQSARLLCRKVEHAVPLGSGRFAQELTASVYVVLCRSVLRIPRQKILERLQRLLEFLLFE